MVEASEWDMCSQERAQIVRQAAKGIALMCFARGERVDDAAANAAAENAEQKAYNRARVESKTTTGARPIDETQKAYLRILSQHVLDVVSKGCVGDSTDTCTGADGRLDLSHTGREFLTEELATSMLEPMLRKGSTVTSIKLSTKSIGLDAAPIVASAVQNVAHCLEEADVSDIIAGRPEAEVLKVLEEVAGALSRCGKLTTLNISDNALGEKGVRACSAVLTASTALESLQLKNIGCSVNACKAVSELVSSPSLKLLHLFNNMSDNAGAVAISTMLEKNTSIQDFRMVSSRVGVEGGQALCSTLLKGSSLVSLDLSDNPMDPDIAPHVASLFPVHKELRNLVLNDLCLGDDGISTLSQALANPDACPQIERLELCLNEISKSSSPALAQALSVKKASLTCVVLAENELECAGAIHVAAGLQDAPKLKELNLSTNMIGRAGAIAVARCCAGIQTIERVELNDNQISEEGVQEVADMLGECLGSLEDNDPEADPEEDVFEEARAECEDIGLDLSKLSLS